MNETEKQTQLEKDLFDIANILNSQQDFTLPESLRSNNLIKMLPDKQDKPKNIGGIINFKKAVPILATATAAVLIIAILPRLDIKNNKNLSAPAAEMSVLEDDVLMGGAGGDEEVYLDSAAYVEEESATEDVYADSFPEETPAEKSDGFNKEMLVDDFSTKKNISENWHGYTVSYDINEGFNLILIDSVTQTETSRLKFKNIDSIIGSEISKNYLYLVLKSVETNYLYQITVDEAGKLVASSSNKLQGQIVDSFSMNDVLYIVEIVDNSIATSDQYIELTGSMEEKSTRVTTINLLDDTQNDIVILNSGEDIFINYGTSQIVAKIDTATKEETAYINFNKQNFELDRVE